MNGIFELASLGRRLIKSYDPNTMDFLKWINNFEYIVKFLHISDDKKVEFLLQLVEPLTHSHIEKKVAPANPLSLPYEELISHFEQLYGIYHGEWAANYRFVIRDQIIGESAIQYAHALTRIASKISLRLRTNMSLMVRFINGLKDEEIKRALLRSQNLTLNRAVAIAAQLEFRKIFTKPN